MRTRTSRRRRSTVAAAAVLGVSALAITACSSSGSSAPKAVSSQSVSASAAPGSRSGTITVVFGGTTGFADGNSLEFVKLLQQDGYTVKTEDISDPSSALRVLVAGQADFFFGSPAEVVTADAHSSADLQVVTSTDQRIDYVMMAKKNYTMNNLSGATVGTAGTGTTVDTVMKSAFTKLKVNGLHYVQVGGSSEEVTAILSGKLDLAPADVSAATAAAATGKAKILFNLGTVLGPFLNQGLITSAKYIKADAQKVQDATNAIIDSERWAQDNESAYLSAIKAADATEGLTTAEQESVYNTLKTGDFNAVNGGLCPSDINQTLSVVYSGGTITKAEAPAQSTWADREFVENYLTAHGQSASAC